MRIQYDRSELHFVSGFVDSFVGLDKHGVTLVYVFECGCVEKFQATRTSSC